MAYRLGEYVVYGELHNKRNYSTFGMIVLRGPSPGRETVVRLDLTGNCDRDLQGKTFRFWPAREPADAPVFSMQENKGFQHRQIGPTGTMTAQGWVRMIPCSPEEFVRRAALGEPPPSQWTRRLYIEWCSQNGRVVVEMAGAIVEECVRMPEGDDPIGEWREVPNLAFPPHLDGQRAAGLGITMVTLDGEDARIEHWRTSARAAEAVDEDEDDSPLQRHLDQEADAIDRAIGFDDSEVDDSDGMDELVLLDECIEGGVGEPLSGLIPGLDTMPRSEDLSDEEAEAMLKVLLSQLALRGVTLDVCKHFTPRSCYELLIGRILPECNTYRELEGTGWVTHVSTWEYCPECEAEIEAEFDGEG